MCRRGVRNGRQRTGRNRRRPPAPHRREQGVDLAVTLVKTKRLPKEIIDFGAGFADVAPRPALRREAQGQEPWRPASTTTRWATASSSSIGKTRQSCGRSLGDRSLGRSPRGSARERDHQPGRRASGLAALQGQAFDQVGRIVGRRATGLDRDVRTAVLRTKDGGATWQRQFLGPLPHMDLANVESSDTLHGRLSDGRPEVPF